MGSRPFSRTKVLDATYELALLILARESLTRTVNIKEFKRLQLAVSSRHRNCVPCSGFVLWNVSSERSNSSSTDVARNPLVLNVKAWEHGVQEIGCLLQVGVTERRQ